MKVKCIGLVNDVTGEADESSSWLTIGKEYVVLEVVLGNTEKILKFRLISDDVKSPTLNHSDNFDVIDDRIPSNWSVKVLPNKWFELSPKAWKVENFWVAYFDGEPWARELYQQEVDKMLAEENDRLNKIA